MATLDEVAIDSPKLPKPELYIIVNSQPTKSNTVWKTLVDVNHIKAALLKVLKKYSTFTNPSSHNDSYTFATY